MINSIILSLPNSNDYRRISIILKIKYFLILNVEYMNLYKQNSLRIIFFTFLTDQEINIISKSGA